MIGTYCQCEQWECYYHPHTECFEPGATLRVASDGRERLYCLDCAIENLRTRREADDKYSTDQQGTLTGKAGEDRASWVGSTEQGSASQEAHATEGRVPPEPSQVEPAHGVPQQVLSLVPLPVFTAASGALPRCEGWGARKGGRVILVGLVVSGAIGYHMGLAVLIAMFTGLIVVVWETIRYEYGISDR